MAQKPAPPTFPNKPPDLKIGDELNRGAWGVVYNGDSGGHSVAVKRIHELLHQDVGEEERRNVLDNFREECKRLQTLDHPHVVGFIGAYTDPRLGPILVMEKMQENLRQFLLKWKKKLQLPKQLRISLEIIRGVAFLHQLTPPLVHRDLNDKNVMLSFEGVIKIGDFGQSKLKKDLYLTTDNPGMLTFMPPEALDVGNSKYTESLDIFSVGVLLMEIGTQQEPQVNVRGIGVIREIERREGDLNVLGEDHPLKPQVLLCLKDNPKERPKASDLQRDVLAMVDGKVEDTADGLKRQIATLQVALQEAREENIARTEREAELTSQFQKEARQNSRRIQELQANCGTLGQDCTTLKEDLRTALEESEARKQHEHILMQQLNQQITLERSLERLNEEITAERKAKCELEEMSTQLQIQLKAYEEDFKAERQDRESAHGRFADREKNWMDQLKALNQERDKLAVDILSLQDQIVRWKREHETVRKELETAKGKVNPKTRNLHENYRAALTEKDAEIGGLRGEIRGLKPIAEQYRVLFAQHKELQSKFESIKVTNHTVQQMVHEMQGEKTAVDSRLRELRTIVNQVTTENEALNQQNAKLKQQIEGFEHMFSGMKSKSQAVEAENAELREAIYLPDMQVSLAARSSQGGGGFRSFQGSIGPGDQHNAMQPVIAGQLRAKQRMDGNSGKGNFDGGQFGGNFIERDSPPSSNIEGKGPSSLELISLPPTALPRGKQPESRSNVPAGRGARPGTDPRMAAGHPPPRGTQQPVVGMSHAMAESHGQLPRGQLPNTTPNQANAYAPSWTLGKHPTDPYLDRQESSASPSTEGSLPMPLIRPGPVTASIDDSLLTCLEADQRYIGEGINTEIRRVASRYKKVEVGAVTDQVQADDQEWPLDPNLTCPYCKVVFRRGQIREYRYHVDGCQMYGSPYNSD